MSRLHDMSVLSHRIPARILFDTFSPASQWPRTGRIILGIVAMPTATAEIFSTILYGTAWRAGMA